ncbi:glycerol-3-phosphate dehydrogenase/oxidase [Alkalibacillus haloalkaliphilus]|uniref:Glycerol-3-phosphate dehydrogenase n=1 Tax=Alkalibacillus haloalkaliphilus TaxID=94136 RepID=A0A511W8U1_9BACI|nr:glycerol-3-phosphate dehydrogenase/oxidase [Alkalibacillus haloalkaliphilus]GEN46768.1 aerobic glycerol-3-phosphate dehydrogenase [Alkalibacillus haloalkaliphilus]
MSTFTNKQRQESKQVLKDQFDVLVIGGGITGAGIALDAATRGYKVAVLEMQDFAAGTSSRSTKLVHGGLRYLKNFEIKLVAEVGKEREIVYENGPHITTPEWMMLPFYKGGNFGPLSTSVGLRVYDFLAGVKKTERRKMLSKDVTLDREPLLKEEGLKGSGYYVEYKTDDARLTIEVMKKAVENGAHAFNYMKVEQLLYNDGKVYGVKVKDLTDGQQHDIHGFHVINAAGPWVDEVRTMDQSKKGKQLFHTKGVHLVFDQEKFPLSQAVYFDTPDDRMVFAIPRDGKTYVGTTDTHYEEDLVNPIATDEDRDYIMDAIEFMFPSVALTHDDIESSWAGIRPLIHEEGKDPSEISRKDEVLESDSGLLSIAGGKLTGYRKMAEHVIDLVAKRLNSELGYTYEKSKTKHLPLAGGEVGGSVGFSKFIQEMISEAEQNELDKKMVLPWVNRYGGNTRQVLDNYYALTDDHDLPKEVLAELNYCLDQEMVYKPTDFLIRRTSGLFFDIDWVETYKEAIMKEMARYFEWSDEQYEQYKAELNKTIEETRLEM